MQIDITRLEYFDTGLNEEYISDLVISFLKHGQIHPVIVRRAGDNFMVIAGNRRVRAAIRLGWVSIDCLVKDDMDEAQIREITIKENLAHLKLEWYERVTMIEEYHGLMVYKHGRGEPGNPHGGNKGWGQRDTAKNLDISLGSLSESLKLAKLIRANPELRRLNLSNVREMI